MIHYDMLKGVVSETTPSFPGVIDRDRVGVSPLLRTKYVAGNNDYCKRLVSMACLHPFNGDLLCFFVAFDQVLHEGCPPMWNDVPWRLSEG